MNIWLRYSAGNRSRYRSACERGDVRPELLRRRWNSEHLRVAPELRVGHVACGSAGSRNAGGARRMVQLVGGNDAPHQSTRVGN